MKFLDLNGLTHFWSNIKDWSNSNFFSNEGGEISPKSGLHYIINGEQLDVSKTGNENESISIFNVDENGISAKRIVMTGGTATQVLMANGSVKTLNAKNGIAGLDSNGNVPLAQLGNLDTTVAEVVTALPTTNIKKHIYLIKDASNVTQNKYEEYIYTGDTSATYDASKWEKLGDFRATVDLADYAKKNKAANKLNITPHESQVNFTLLDIDGGKISDNVLGQATSTQAGVMIPSDKKKLDGIANNANNYSLPTASSTIKGGITLGYSQNGKNYPVVLDTNGKAYVNVPWIDTNTTYDLSPYAKKSEAVGSIDVDENANAIDFEYKDINNTTLGYFSLEKATEKVAGVMSSEDRKKLNSIASGATADSAITTTEIDALFA
jgi:hypothetical protein